MADTRRIASSSDGLYLDRPYYRWWIRLNSPASSEITFGAVGSRSAGAPIRW